MSSPDLKQPLVSPEQKLEPEAKTRPDVLLDRFKRLTLEAVTRLRDERERAEREAKESAARARERVECAERERKVRIERARVKVDKFLKDLLMLAAEDSAQSGRTVITVNVFPVRAWGVGWSPVFSNIKTCLFLDELRACAGDDALTELDIAEMLRGHVVHASGEWVMTTWQGEGREFGGLSWIPASLHITYEELWQLVRKYQ
jgi:hypothetical protein